MGENPSRRTHLGKRGSQANSGRASVNKRTREFRILKCCLRICKCLVYDFEKFFNDFEMFLMIVESCLMILKCVFNDLSSNSNNFGSQNNYSLFSGPKLFRLVLKSLNKHFKIIKQLFKS